MQELVEESETPGRRDSSGLVSKDLIVAVTALSEWLDERTRAKRALQRVRRALESFRAEATEEEIARIEAVVDDVAKRLDLRRREPRCG